MQASFIRNVSLPTINTKTYWITTGNYLTHRWISRTQDTKPTASSSSEWFVNGNTPLHFTQIAFLAIWLSVIGTHLTRHWGGWCTWNCQHPLLLFNDMLCTWSMTLMIFFSISFLVFLLLFFSGTECKISPIRRLWLPIEVFIYTLKWYLLYWQFDGSIVALLQEHSQSQQVVVYLLAYISSFIASSKSSNYVLTSGFLLAVEDWTRPPSHLPEVYWYECLAFCWMWQ